MGCNTCGSSGSGSENYEQKGFEAPTDPQSIKSQFETCVSHKGKFFDIITEEFVIPEVGKEAYIHLCEASLWQKGMWIGVYLPNNGLAAFKVTERKTKKIKVLNGCDKSGDTAIYGQPAPGTLIANNSIIFPLPPRSCDAALAQEILDALNGEAGVAAVEEILSNSDNICFTNIPDLDAAEEGHAFVGTMPDCDCDDDELFSSCLRKVKRIFTGQSGKTWCMPDVAVVNLQPVNDVPKRLAVFDENKCLKAGPVPSELLACDSFVSLDEDTPIDFVLTCDSDVLSKVSPPGNKYIIDSRKQGGVLSEDNDPEAYKWFVRKRGLFFYPLDDPMEVITQYSAQARIAITNFDISSIWDSVNDDGIYLVFELKVNTDVGTGYYWMQANIETQDILHAVRVNTMREQFCSRPIKVTAGIFSGWLDLKTGDSGSAFAAVAAINSVSLDIIGYYK